MAFVKQFGRVLRVRVARSKRTGGSKGYGFVEMQLPKVAAIVAETLSGYILFGQRRLVCHVVPPEKVHVGLFVRKQHVVRKKPRQRLALEKMKAITNRLVAREQKKRQTLKELGIDYEFPGYERSGNVEEQEGKKSKKKKRKDSVSSGDGGERSAKIKKRKDSVSSVDAEQSDGRQKKRKDSMSSTDGVQESGGKKKKRRESFDKETKNMKTRESADTTKGLKKDVSKKLLAKDDSALDEKAKTKSKKKNKSRRKSS